MEGNAEMIGDMPERREIPLREQIPTIVARGRRFRRQAGRAAQPMTPCPPDQFAGLIRPSSPAQASALTASTGTGGVEQDPLGVRAEDELAHRRTATQTDHDEVRLVSSATAIRSSAGSMPRTSWRTSWEIPAASRSCWTRESSVS